MDTTIVDSKRKEMIQIAFPAQLSEDQDYRAFSRSCTGKPFDWNTEEFGLRFWGAKEFKEKRDNLDK